MFKPSELPVGTVIQDNDVEHGVYYWFKGDPGVWGEMFAVRTDYGMWVADDYASIDPINLPSFNRIRENSDDYFKNFKIISLPIEISEQLAEGLSGYVVTEWHNDSTPGSELAEAIKDSGVEK